MNRITSIIFDLDGTLYFSHSLAAEIQSVAAEGIAVQIGISAVESAIRLSEAKSELSAITGCEATLSAACEKLDCDIRLLHQHLAETVAPEKHLTRDDRVIRLLQTLSRNYDLFIYTNNNRPLTERIMQATGISGLFRDIFSVEDFWRAKPDRLALAKLYAAMGAEPIECLFVGDRYDVDLRLPEEHGSRVITVKCAEDLLSLNELLIPGENHD